MRLPSHDRNMYDARANAPELCKYCRYMSYIAEHDHGTGYHAVIPICTAYDEPENLCEDMLSSGECPHHPREEETC